MDPAARAKIMRQYRRFLRRHGPTVRALDWVSEAAQKARFQVLAEVGPWEGMSVADIGCGLGDFFGFLRDRGHSVKYTGYDITPEMIDAARAKFPDPTACFEVRDILEEGLSGSFDYVVASGTFNIRVDDHDDFLKGMLVAMYEGCRRAVAFNVLKPVPPTHPDHAFNKLFYRDFYYEIPPEDLLALCRTLSPRVELRHEEVPSDSTVFIHRPMQDPPT